MSEANKAGLKKTRFFRVAVSGTTIDGRIITPEQIDEMASTYSQQTYGARVNIEHIRGYFVDSQFKMYGDIVGLKADDYTINGEERRALYAQFEVTSDLVEINQKSQKIYSSIEMIPNFAGTNKAYCVGLAVTDSPASLGTEALKFSANFNIQTFTTDALETELIFDADKEDKTAHKEEDQSFFTALVEKLFKNREALNRDDLKQAFTTMAEEFTKHDESRLTQLSTLEEKINELKQQYRALEQTLESYSKTPITAQFRTPAITGSETDIEEATF